MPREVEPSLNEKQFILKALDEGLRLDGRAFDQYRDIELTFGDEYGVADVRLGKTRVLTTISAEVTTPFPDRPFNGIFTITTELSPMSTPSFEPNRPTSSEILLSRLLEKTLRRSQALDTESLCLLAASKVWSVRADVHVLSLDGNLIDASCLCVLAALAHFRRPDVSVAGGEVTVYTAAERAMVPLSLLHMPFCVSFSTFGGGEGEEEVVLLDAEGREEALREGAVTVSVNRHGEVCQIAKLGGRAVEAVAVLGCVMVAAERVKELDRLVVRALKEDAGRRDEGGVSKELSAENAR